MDPSIPNSNTSRNVDADGKPLYPSVYEFEEIQMINRNGDEEDITHLVTSFIIAEEIYSPVLTGKIRIRDNVNFFEDFQLDGREIVKVKIKYLDSVEENTFETLTYQFVVKDYPLFEKTKESINVQEYEINLISAFSYLSRLQQISRGVEGNPVQAIEDIFKTYLAYSKFDYESKARYPCLTDNLKAVITQRTPLQAVEYLKTLCYDEHQSPFFVYTTLKDDSVTVRSWADIIDENSNPTYEPTADHDSYQLLTGSVPENASGSTAGERVENLKHLRSRIISLNSNIKLDKLNQAVAGGIGSVTEVIDFEARSYNEERVIPKTENLEQTIGTNEVVDNSDLIFGGLSIGRGRGTSLELDPGDFDFTYLENLDFDDGQRPRILDNILNDPRTSQSVYYLPISPYPEEFVSPAQIKLAALPYVKKYKANMESAVHEIAVYGDPNLKAATKIKIKIPKAVDTTQDEPGIDDSLSGVYVIGVNIHQFENGVYTNRLRIIKDTNLINAPTLPSDGSIPYNGFGGTSAIS